MSSPTKPPTTSSPPYPFTSTYIPPPRSKTRFYTTSPHWSDITPIPLVTHQPGVPDPGPALATIAYSERYTEAMEYLRGVMAVGVGGERVLALTEDVIGMNPAHYTVWGWRMRVLGGLWGVEGEVTTDGGGGEIVGGVVEEVDEEDKEKRVREGVERELRWLESVSERNLKNYQIWHHRQQLLSTLPLPDPNNPNTTSTQSKSTHTFLHTTEIPFLTHILSFDAKNYHVWTYRAWLCRRYPTYLLSPLSTSPNGESSEVLEIERLLEEDIRNNSAWSHRYFCVFGYEELCVLESEENLDLGNEKPLTRRDLFCQRNGGTRGDEEGNLLKVRDDVREREIRYAKTAVERTPMNLSCWNYLRGVAKRCDIPIEVFLEFCERFLRPVGGMEGGERLDEELGKLNVQRGEKTETVGPAAEGVKTESDADEWQDELDFMADSVRSSHAIAMIADICSTKYIESLEGETVPDEEAKQSAIKAWTSLARKWDPIRKNYWEWRIKGMEGGKFGVGMVEDL